MTQFCAESIKIGENAHIITHPMCTYFGTLLNHFLSNWDKNIYGIEIPEATSRASEIIVHWNFTGIAQFRNGRAFWKMHIVLATFCDILQLIN